jgi:hypothetical protein
MNPPTPVDVVAQVTQAGGGSATRQAIQAALAGLAADGAAQQAASQQTQTSEQSAMRAQQDGVRDALTNAVPSSLSTLQAQRSNLAPANTSPAGVDMQAPVSPADAAAMTHNVAPPQAMPLQGVLAVPVALSALQAQAVSTPARTSGAAQDDRLTRVQRREGGAQQDDTPDDSDADAHEQAANTAEDAEHADDNAAPDQRVTQWLQRLTTAGQDEALRDLRLSRHVLLVLPQRSKPTAKATAQARAVLLSARGVLELRAHWWPGAAALAPSVANTTTNTSLAWQRFRLFRDGDLLLRGGLRTRAGSMACRLLLGAGSAAAANAALGAFNALGGLNDTATARLLLAERARVAQALAAQWTLLLLVVPEHIAHV